MCLVAPRSALALGTALLKKHFNAFYNLTSQCSSVLNTEENRKTNGFGGYGGHDFFVHEHVNEKV